MSLLKKNNKKKNTYHPDQRGRCLCPAQQELLKLLIKQRGIYKLMYSFQQF